MQQNTPIIIIGATGGVGQSLGRLLVASGQGVHLIARDQSQLVPLADELGASWAVADVLDHEQLSVAVQAAGEAVSGLCYAVGDIQLKPLRATTAQAMSDAFQLHTVSAMVAIQAAQKALKAGGGSVVLFSSLASQVGLANHAIMASAKGAVEGLTVALAAELAPHVRINAIAPSLTEIKMAAPLLANEAMVKGLAKVHPLKRLGRAEDLANAAAWLLGPDSGWVTGQVIGVDGGRSSIAGV